MTHDMLHVMEWHNGDKDFLAFSDAEMARRQAALREWMAANDVDAALFTSHQSLVHVSGWLYCAFGRKIGMVLTQTAGTTISSGIDGGRPWRRSFGANISYTDWRRDNFYRALRQLTHGVQRLALEYDHISLDDRRKLEAALPGVEMVDIGPVATALRMVKSAEELALLRQSARIGGIGIAAGVSAISAGMPEYEIAIAATNAMIREAGGAFPMVELMDIRALAQSGLNTDGAHNPVTNRRLRSGDILHLACFASLFGYSAAPARTFFCDSADAASIAVWKTNIAVHQRGIDLVKPGVRCSEIAAELNAIYRENGLLKQRSCGFGQSAGIIDQHYGHEPALDLREDNPAELQPGMVVSIEPMVMLTQGTAGAGGYRDRDVLIVTETGAECITDLPAGPDHNILHR